ncbi:MAG: hypothetical protein ABGX27_03105 [Desulfurobacteriaceae bacterium]
MIQLLLIFILLCIGTLFLFSLKLLFILKNITTKLEEIEAELVKEERKIDKFSDRIIENEEKIKFLQNQYKILLQKLRGVVK